MIENFWLFAFTTLMLNVTPGNDMVYVATRSLGGGVRTGIIAGLGISAGILCHTLAVVAGLSALIGRSPVVFTIIKLAGACYLLYLGIKSFFDKTDLVQSFSKSKQVTDKEALVQGMITCLLNPKVGIFFLAFLPQFANPESTSFQLQILLLGLWFIFSGTVINIIVAVIFGKMAAKLLNKPNYWKWQGKVTGLIFWGLGFKILFEVLSQTSKK